MRYTMIYAALALGLLTACSSSQDIVYSDDIYYNPDDASTWATVEEEYIDIDDRYYPELEERAEAPVEDYYDPEYREELIGEPGVTNNYYGNVYQDSYAQRMNRFNSRMGWNTFDPFWDPFWGPGMNNGLTINMAFGNTWGNPWGGFNPGFGWNSWGMNRFGWNSGFGWHAGFGWNSGWGNPYWRNPWMSPWSQGFYDPWGFPTAFGPSPFFGGGGLWCPPVAFANDFYTPTQVYNGRFTPLSSSSTGGVPVPGNRTATGQEVRDRSTVRTPRPTEREVTREAGMSRGVDSSSRPEAREQAETRDRLQPRPSREAIENDRTVRPSRGTTRPNTQMDRGSREYNRNSRTPSRNSNMNRGRAPSRSNGTMNRSRTPSRNSGNMNRGRTPSRSNGTMNRGSSPSRNSGNMNRSRTTPSRSSGTMRSGGSRSSGGTRSTGGRRP